MVPWENHGPELVAHETPDLFAQSIIGDAIEPLFSARCNLNSVMGEHFVQHSRPKAHMSVCLSTTLARACTIHRATGPGAAAFLV
jgi:hypothetical protein